MSNEARTPGSRRYDFNTHFMELTREGDVFWVAKINAPNRPIKECAELGCEIADKLNAHPGLVAENERLKEVHGLFDENKLATDVVNLVKQKTALVRALKEFLDEAQSHGEDPDLFTIWFNEDVEKLRSALRQAGETVEGT